MLREREINMEWLDRALVVSPYFYGLCLSENDFRKELKKLKVQKDQWPPFLASGSANASAHFFDGANGSRSCIIAIGSTKGRSVAQIHAMLVHEAVHLWQEIRSDIGEKQPSSEFEAYAVQALSQRLIESYETQRKKK